MRGVKSEVQVHVTVISGVLVDNVNAQVIVMVSCVKAISNVMVTILLCDVE